MSTRPHLTRSIPFWLLIAGSLASVAGGAFVLLDRLGGMDARLTAGTATSNDVYVGQIWAVLGTVLVGAGLVGLALALTLGALRSLIPAPSADPSDAAVATDADDETTQVVDESDVDPRTSPAEAVGDAETPANELGYDETLGYDEKAATAVAPRV